MSTSLNAFVNWFNSNVPEARSGFLEKNDILAKLKQAGEDPEELEKIFANHPFSKKSKQKIISQWRSTFQIIALLDKAKREEIPDNFWETGNEIKYIPGLYVGSYMPASNKEWLQKEQITHILVVSEQIAEYFPGEFTYKRIKVFDVPESDLFSHFNDSNEWIDKAFSENGKVLIHW